MDQFIFFLFLTLLIPFQLVYPDTNSSDNGRLGQSASFEDLEKRHEENVKKLTKEHDQESNKMFIIVGCSAGALFVLVCCIAIFCGRRRRPIHPGQAAFLPMAMGMDGAPPFPPAQYPQGPLPQEDAVPPQSPTV